MRATRAVIHLDALKSNISKLKARQAAFNKKPLICFPVKADAYGHGAAVVAKEALKCGVSHLAVATVDEGVSLRESGVSAPILLLSHCLPAEAEEVCEARLVPFVSGLESIRVFEEASAKTFSGGKLPVFLKIDSGMGRLGCAPEDAPDLALRIKESPCLEYAGTATHFAVSGSATNGDAEYTRRQTDVFKTALAGISAFGVDPGIVTAANSGACVSYPDSWFDMVRPGIILYGYQEAGSKPALDFKPVMELVTKIVHIKTVRKGESVSYGRTWRAEDDSVIGVLPAGYADGLPRVLSGKYQVSCGGRLCQLAGLICMDQCMVDLGKNPRVKLFDDATIFGGAPPSLSAADAAERSRSIPYEILCNISKRVPRVYTR
ncbi:MAG: alanine racemase [Spirochaetaceae bacterium]|jgi:alanine racemase|nr:alanine racemase [Spirochaetaceae bacterium]